jgi:hypothetical protein
MSDEPLIRRITKLLRLARDQPGTPEGRTAENLANLLMRKHELEVELEDHDVEESMSALLTTQPAPVRWMEYLAMTLAAAYRCSDAPHWTGLAWQLWIYSDDPLRVSSCQEHYRHLAEQLLNRVEVMRTTDRLLYLLHMSKDRYDVLLSSYAQGVVYELSRRLLERLGWSDEPPFMEDGFDMERFCCEAWDPLELECPEVDDGFQEPGLRRLRHRIVPVSIPLAEGHEDVPVPPPESTVMDFAMFAQGRRDGRYIHLIPSRLVDAFP